jgi:hypothetical protein
MTYLGVDPGKSGSICAITRNGALAHETPETDQDVVELLQDLNREGDCFAILEFVSASPQMGVTSAFTFGQGYGKLQMALCAAKIPYDRVTPGKWQTAMRCLSGGDKRITKARAQELFPGMKITHRTADGLLIAEYCRRLKTGEIARDAPPKPKKKKASPGEQELDLTTPCPPAPTTTPTPTTGTTGTSLGFDATKQCDSPW